MAYDRSQSGWTPWSMLRTAPWFWIALALFLLLGPEPAHAQVPWTGWGHSSTVAVRNNATTALPTGYTVQLVLDTATLVSQGQLRPDCADLRVSYVGGSSDVELDRLVVGANTATTTVSFRSQAAIGLAGSDTNYRLHYGKSDAGSPPTNLKNVYAFYDDFQSGTATGWTTKGTWNVVADGGNYVYRYTSGGANWALAYVPMAGLADIDYVARVRAAASTNWIGLAFRIQDQANFLTFYESKDVGQFKLANIVADNHSILAYPAFTMNANTWYWLRLQAIGNQVRGRIWQDGGTEPTSWMINQTDATYQTASNIGATLYNHSTNAGWDEFKVRRLVAAEPTVTVLADEYTLTLSTLGSGLVAKSPDQANYHYGDGVTLTATAAEGWTFAGWSGGLTGNPTTVTILGNTAVTARFTKDVAPWWNNAWAYRARVTVTNTSATDALGVGYSTRLTLDTASLLATGRVLGDCADLRVVAFDGISNTELDRVVEKAGSSQTDVWFALPVAIGPGAQDNGYYVYYGNASAGAPPANGSSVFLYYEDWEQGATHWTNAGGLDPGNTGTLGHSVISSLEAVSPGNSQQFPVKAGGGDAFSGYIPVTPGGGYAIGVWGKSGTTAYVPVGIDPYDAGKVKGAENWLWTSEWPVGTPWSQRSGRFTAPANAAFIKIKSEWWAEGPGTAPVYLDNLYLRRSLASEPGVVAGNEETTLSVPVISNIGDTGPIEIGAAVTVSATVATADGTIDAVTLRLQTPEAADVAMSLVGGTSVNGTWQAPFTPAQGGIHTYRILAHSTIGRSTLSAARTFTVADLSPPQITLVGITDPILVKNTQTLTVGVTDNGAVDSVTVTVDGVVRAMSLQGGHYVYAWRVATVGTIGYTVRATDTGGNHASLSGTFASQAREADVSTWLGGKAGAASWSIDDGNSSCVTELEAAGIRGTYFYNGSGTPSWFADYSARGHEIGSHSVGHPCDAPSCKPNCTPQGLWQIPFTEAEMLAYRQDQLDPNVAGIEAGTGKPVLSMAWPCGCADARRMTAAAPYFLSVRGYYDYIAELTWIQDVNLATPVEFMNLNSSNSYNQAHIDQAAAEGKWAIVTSHGSCDGIFYMGSRQDVLWVAPIGEVLKYIKVRDAAQFSNYSRAGRTIAFDAVHNLGTVTRRRVDLTALLPVVFDNPVTLKVHILDTDAVLGVKIDGVPVSYTIRALDGTRYVTCDAALNTSRHVVVTLSKPTPTIDQVADNGPVELGSPAQVTARVTVSEGPVQNVRLHLTAPQAAEYPMALVSGTTDTYAASFVPDRIASHTYHVSAANDEGTTSESVQRAFTVRDLTPPQWRSLAQTLAVVPVGQVNTLSAEGMDPGGLQWAVLATDESGTWQEFNWAGSDWWNHLWAKRLAITVRETAGLARSKETIDVLVSSAQFVGLANCAAELRVADASRQEVPCQVYDVQNNGGTITCHLLFQADLDANASRTYYVYYGNPAAVPPTYDSDLAATASGGLLTVRNTFFNLDLDTGSGVVSRVQLPTGTNTNLPLSTQANAYWGWHQVCSSGDGNITGKNSLCVGGTTPASGLVLTTLIDGPVVKVFEFTSAKGAATYRMTYRFVANAPYYQYDLAREGTGASVMNNFWYGNGNYARLGSGSGGAPATVFNTYDNGADHVRMASVAAVGAASIDGTDNDGTELGGIDYRFPSAAGLSLCVATAVTQVATEDVLARRANPPTSQLGVAENAPQGQYGSPFDGGGATNWTPTAFTWQNGAIPDGRIVRWRIKYCDVSGNCGTTEERSFRVGSGDEVTATVPAGACISTAHPCVTVPVIFTRTDATPLMGYSVTLQLSPELTLCGAELVSAGHLRAPRSFQVTPATGNRWTIDEVTLGTPCGVTGSDTLFMVSLGSGAAAGTGTITIENLLARDCGNNPLPANPGPVATVPIDNTAPAVAEGLAGHAAGVGTGGAGMTKVAITFTPPSDGSQVVVYRKGYGSYPQYGTGPTPGAPPQAPTSYPPPSGWELTGVTTSGQSDDPPTRDSWYYVAYSIDGCGNTAASALTGGTLNYLLGDVADGTTDCAGNNVVNTADVSLLGAHYGAALLEPGYLACLDVGPTVGYSLTGRPVPDGMIEFEDLVLFALNYGTSVGAPQARARPASRPEGAVAGADALALELPRLPAVGESFTVLVRATAGGTIQALKLELGYDRAVVEMEGVAAGELLGRQGAQVMVLTPGPGRVDVALLGAGAGLSGSGELVQVRFRVKAAGAAALTLKSAEGRDGTNRKVALNGEVVATQPPQLPTRTWFSAPAPNPFSRTTTLSFALARGGAVELAVYGVDGRKVATLVAESREPGQYQVSWDGRDGTGQVVRPGMYYARLVTPQGRFTRTLVLMR